MAKNENGFVIFGRISGDQSGKGLEGLTVEALDKDLLNDDRLGSVKTDKEGRFEIAYTKNDFKEVFLDDKPDIYLRIKNSKGEIIYTTEDKVKNAAAHYEEINIVISDSLIDKVEVENERLQFKQLISINPNYFGNAISDELKKNFSVVNQFSGNTYYEQLSCVGLYPEDNLLEAVLEIKSPYGYKGALCSEGSKEYVAFYIDYHDGSGFVSAGAAAEVNVHDLTFVDGNHLHYAVRKPFVPKYLKKCSQPQIVTVRAILSWEAVPTGPSYVPVWGNIVNTKVQIKPKHPVFVFPVPELELKPSIPPEFLEVPVEINKIPDPIPPVEQFTITGNKEQINELVQKSIEAEKQIKEGGKVEKERYDYKQILKENPNYFGSIAETKNKDEVLKAVNELPEYTLKKIMPKLIINPDWLTPGMIQLYNTSYEELKCVGLYPENDLLEAVIEIKRPYGYNGNLCTLGSTEYVAFYIDWGAGYQHAATAKVGVHDIIEAGDQHLFYAVKANISGILSKLKNCNVENIVSVKAILSWNHDPSPYGHNYVPAWGNVLKRYVQIRPKDGLSTKCDIEIVNEVHVADISQSGINEGYAIKIDGTGSAVPFSFDRPFGGTIGCWGNVNVPGAHYYRFRYSDDNGASWKDITDDRIARHPFAFFSTIKRTPDGNGWFSISDYNFDVSNYSLSALVHWNSRGLNTDVILRLELADFAKNPIPGQECEVSLMLDNKGIEFFEFGGTPTPLPAEGIVVKDAGGNYKKCETFSGSESIRIYGNFKDEHFKSYSLTVFGGNINISGVHIASGRYDSGIAGINSKGIIGAHDGSLGLQLDALNLCTIPQSPGKVKCAYGIKLTVSDRAIVGYVRGYEFDTTRHAKHGYVTFDWDPAG
jgi:hypothetical protein